MTSEPRLVAVVLVHWNQAEDLLETVEQFLSQDCPVAVTVVDNASEPEQLEVVRGGIELLNERSTGERPNVDLLELEHNTGFGPGANAGLRACLDTSEASAEATRPWSDWIALAPHDVAVDRTTLSKMLDAAAARPMAGLMCADVGDGMCPAIDPYFGGMTIPAEDERPPIGDARWETVDYPHGTLMMLRRQCLLDIGLFDERFFSYCEEADLALRARSHGWTVGLIRGARVRNRNVGSTVWLVDYLQTRNTLLLVQEMSGWYHTFIRMCFSLSQIVKGTVFPDRRPYIYNARARLLGIRDFALRRFGPPPS